VGGCGASGSALPWRYAAAADFSGVRRPGSYRVRVGELSSRRWVVGKGARRSMLRRLLRVFAVNRDGREPNPVFGPAHLNDAVVAEGPYAGQRFDLTAAAERAARTAFGTPGPSFGSVQDLGGSGAMAAVAERSAGVGGGRRIGAAARDYLLGRNPWGASFVVGRGPGEARNPHHPAYLKGPPARLLDGAVVGGPATPSDLGGSGLPPASGPYARFNSPSAVYEDRREDFVTSEVGLAYSASAILLAASLSGG